VKIYTCIYENTIYTCIYNQINKILEHDKKHSSQIIFQDIIHDVIKKTMSDVQHNFALCSRLVLNNLYVCIGGAL